MRLFKFKNIKEKMGYQFARELMMKTGNTKKAKKYVELARNLNDFGSFEEGMLKVIAENPEID